VLIAVGVCVTNAVSVFWLRKERSLSVKTAMTVRMTVRKKSE
jgi:hypothetical protein